MKLSWWSLENLEDGKCRILGGPGNLWAAFSAEVLEKDFAAKCQEPGDGTQ